MSVFQDYAGSGSNVGGHYRWSGVTGAVTGLTANQTMFCFRWTDSTRYCRVRQVRVGASMNTAFGTAQTSDIQMLKATGWTTAPTAGGTVTQPTGLMNQMMDGAGVSAAPNSLGGNLFTTIANNIAISNTAALTTGSPTIDSNGIGADVFNIIALGSSDRVTLLDTVPGFDYPLTLVSNEGFVLQIPTAQGATGKVVYYVTVVFAVNNTAF